MIMSFVYRESKQWITSLDNVHTKRLFHNLSDNDEQQQTLSSPAKKFY